MTPPIRFLALVVGGWTAARVIALLPMAEANPVARPPTEMSAVDRPVAVVRIPAMLGRTRSTFNKLVSLSAAQAPGRLEGESIVQRVAQAAPSLIIGEPEPAVLEKFYFPRSRAAALASTAEAMPVMTSAAPPGRMPGALPDSIAAPVRASPRLTGSLWMLARGGGTAAVATNGLVGGSQAGARLLYRVAGDPARPLSLSTRLSGPLRRSDAEAALGVEWQPVAGLPVRFLAERRQRVSGEGRSAFALLAHGGLSDRPVAGGLRLDAYAQAGVVGVRRRDLFADGGVTLVRPLGLDGTAGVALGAGVWGGAQPGAYRLDVGPRLTATLGSARARVSLDWRLRVAGGAAPSSGPSLTIGTDF